jgi:prophage regulatory protein
MAAQLRNALTILRRKQVEGETGYSRSTVYLRISQRLFTRPVSLGARAVGWPAAEVAALNAARIAGKSDEHIRALVAELETARQLKG